MSWETLAAIVAILTALVTVSAAIVRLYKTRSEDKKGEKKISIELTDPLERMNLRYGVLHVRDGTDEDYKPKMNREHDLEREDGRKYAATVNYTERLGFQFKCFAEYGNHNFANIKQLLEDAGYKYVSQGRQDTEKVWFVSPEYGEVRTREGFVNNFYFPY
jgi:hypothetical protein